MNPTLYESFRSALPKLHIIFSVLSELSIEKLQQEKNGIANALLACSSQTKILKLTLQASNSYVFENFHYLLHERNSNAVHQCFQPVKRNHLNICYFRSVSLQLSRKISCQIDLLYISFNRLAYIW